MWVKICGNTRLEDCLATAELGADAVGFVFAEGKRTVTTAQVAAMTKLLPPGLETIGVFNTGSAVALAYAVERAHLSGVQLHREYDPYIIQRMREYLGDHARPRVLQVISWRVDESARQQAAALAKMLSTIEADGLVDAVLLDSSTAGASGGTGMTFDWGAASAVLQAAKLPFIVAGGLTPVNVGEAVQVLQPAGVDVSSGVEQAPGIKDLKAVERFLTQARAASKG